MDILQLVSSNLVLVESDELKRKFNKKVREFPTEISWDNTESSLGWIVRGGIDYFSNLDSDFLGKGNEPGIPCMEADSFANNIYRLVNAIDYLAKLRKFKLKKSNQLNLLLDIRTLIVHSGEQVTDLRSFGLVGYKDSQLGRIFKKEEIPLSRFMKEFSDMDYCITVWNDRHDKSQKHHLSEVDYNRKNENYKDVDIYLKAKDVKNVILEYVEAFINYNIMPRKEKRRMIDIPKEKIFSKKKIDFEIISRIISKDLRGGYVIENGVGHWYGFGLQKLFEYVQKKIDVPEETRIFIMDKIKNTMCNYWDAFKNEEIADDKLPDLDIREVFKEYTPYYEFKGYLEGEKLFSYIAPNFNTFGIESTDLDYLYRFISNVNNVLSKPLLLEQDVDDLICNYFVQAVQETINRNKKEMNEKECLVDSEKLTNY
ncbi:hypothetical protein ACIJDO_000238 [Enterococcus hirae]